MHGVIDKGRIVLQELRPPAIPSTRLEHALSELLDEIAPAAGPRLRIVVTGHPKNLSSAIQEQIYQIGREALVNALRHSSATSIEAEVEYLPRRIRVRVRDNGRGIEQKVLTARNSDRGLRAMLERARAMGAQLQIWSKPGSGTEVELSLPFDTRSMPALVP
jgi:signal transduction histidine kinase